MSKIEKLLNGRFGRSLLFSAAIHGVLVSYMNESEDEETNKRLLEAGFELLPKI